jgi:hypothetical protein
MFKNIFGFTKQATNNQEENKDEGLIEKPCEDLKQSELPLESDQIRLDFSHNPFAP